MELNELSENVHKHFIRSAVLDVTDDEVTEILELYPNDNPLNHTNFIGNVTHSDDIPKEGPIDFFINVAKMVMCSNDPIRKAFIFAIEYINNDGLTSDEIIEESANGLTDLFRYRVECLREMEQIDTDSDSKAEDIGDNWRRV